MNTAATVPSRTFWLEVDADGAPFIWQGHARNEQEAFRRAAEVLAVKFPEVTADRMRLTACIETTGAPS